jgi:hypothetical protein
MSLLTIIEKHGLRELTALSLLHFPFFMCTKRKGYNYGSIAKGGIYHLCQISILIEAIQIHKIHVSLLTKDNSTFFLCLQMSLQYVAS